MNKVLKSKWLKALRSGRYKQGDSYLRLSYNRAPARYCCLGVLAQIQGAKWDADGRPTIGGKPVGFKASPLSFLTPSAAGGLSLLTQKRLGNMNDGTDQFIADGCATFKKIADYIEKRL